MTVTEKNGKKTYCDAQGRLIGTAVSTTKPVTPTETIRIGIKTEAHAGNSDYSSLRAVMQQRAISRNTNNDVHIEQATSNEGLIKTVISLPVTAVMFVAVIPMAIIDAIMKI